MVPGKMGLLICVMLLCFARSIHAVVLGADCSAAACDDLTAMVCDPIDDKCKVKADGTTTDCGGDDTKCPTNAACALTVCNCGVGFAVITSTGLCGVGLSGDCSVNPCGSDFVCETSACKVKPDGTTTDCGDDDTKCPTNALCYTDVCKCSIGYKVSSDLCIAATCTADSDCTSSITNSMCSKIYPCSKGTCACKSGYSGDDCEKLGYQKACTTGAGDKCDDSLNLECAAGETCDCKATFTYKSALGFCTDKKVLGETCNVGDCYTTLNAECDTTCKCSAGYYQDGQTCRYPYAGATCTDTCAKVPTISLLSGGESSQQTPTCATTNNKCDCDSDETVSRKIGDTCYTVCLSAYAGTAKAAGVECAAFHECESKVCAQCPDDANPKCYNAPCSGSTISGSILVSSIILLSILF